mgnify:CR=1 FL=1
MKKMIKPLKPINISKPNLKGALSQSESKPWSDIFKQYGFRDSHIPTTPPPPKETGYGNILTWVTSDGFEPFEYETNLAIDIWMGKIDVWNIIPTQTIEKEISNETPSFFKKM